MFRDNTLLGQLRAGQTCTAVWLFSGSATNAEIVGGMGFAAVIIDREHTPGGLDTTVEQMRAVRAAGDSTVLVRPSRGDAAEIKLLLDVGAEGLLVPDVRTADQVRDVVAACHYPPQGVRGTHYTVSRAAGWGADAGMYLERYASELLIGVMIESAEGAANAAEIAAVPGLDLVFIGPLDLSADAGLMGRWGDPEYLAMHHGVERDVLGSGALLGSTRLPTETLDDCIARGQRFVTVGSDVSMLRAGGAVLPVRPARSPSPATKGDARMTHVDTRSLHVTEGTVPFGDHTTWYRVTSATPEPLATGRPLVVAHGGPGCTHDYLLSLTDLVREDRPVIHYDQIGNGRSTHLPDVPSSFWRVETFLAELDALLTGLGIADDYDFLGQSWGGMLGAEHAARQPSGLRNLIIADSPASMPLWLEAAAALRAELPRDVAEALERNEAAGTFDTEEYKAATAVYYARHVTRISPAPPDVLLTRAAVAADPTVYHTMNGPNEFHVIGSLRQWSVVDRLPSVAARTLVINGRYDEATDATVLPFVEKIPGALWHRFDESSHMPHLEEREEFMRVVAGFLDNTGDASAPQPSAVG